MVFRLAEEEYAVPIEYVKEVTITPVVSKMPKAPSFIKGVASIRGDVIAILDLEKRFNLKARLNFPSKDTRQSYTMVIDIDDYRVGYLTREMPHTLFLRESQIDTAAHVVKRSKILNEFIEGLGKANGRIIIILNLHKLLNDKEIQFLTNVNSESNE